MMFFTGYECWTQLHTPVRYTCDHAPASTHHAAAAAAWCAASRSVCRIGLNRSA